MNIYSPTVIHYVIQLCEDQMYHELLIIESGHGVLHQYIKIRKRSRVNLKPISKHFITKEMVLVLVQFQNAAWLKPSDMKGLEVAFQKLKQLIYMNIIQIRSWFGNYC